MPALLLALLGLLVVPAVAFPRSRRSRTAPAKTASAKRRCALSVATFVLELCLLPALLPQALQQLRPKHPDATTAARWEAGLDVLLVLMSPGAPFARQWGTGTACMLLNHADGESVWLKHTFAASIRAWSAQHGCAYTAILPPTFFPKPLAALDPNGAHDDCSLLFTRYATRAAASNASTPRVAAVVGRGGPANRTHAAGVWFQKDALKGSHGRGVQVLSTAQLRREWRMRRGHEAHRCAEIAASREHMPGQILIQPAVARPLLLWGGRKFDVRLYILLADRKPFSAWLTNGYIRFCDKPSEAGDLDKAAHVANVDVAPEARRHRLEEHYAEHAMLRELLASEEAEATRRRLGLTADGAYDLLQRRLRVACAYMVRAMAPAVQREGGHARGRWLLLGVDVIVDEELRPTIIEANSNPELTMDGVRSSLNRRLARTMFDLLLEAHLSARPLFGDMSGDRGCATADADFEPAARGSPAAERLLRTSVPGWSLLYSDAVRPPFSFAPPCAGFEANMADAGRA
eukprot:2476505-Prymnesium_polylepis.2